jgi:RNA polymerase sigma-70 factor (sigma-E family)
LRALDVTLSHQDEYVEFVTARLKRLRTLAYQLTGDWHRADDLVQTTLTKTLLQWGRVRAAADIDQYVRAILVNAFLSERRAGWSRVRLVDVVPEPPPSRSTGIEDRAVMQAALARLPKRQRAVIVLRFLCDLSIEETAKVLDCATGTIKSQTHHGLAALRGALTEHATVLTRAEQ